MPAARKIIRKKRPTKQPEESPSKPSKRTIKRSSKKPTVETPEVITREQYITSVGNLVREKRVTQDEPGEKEPNGVPSKYCLEYAEIARVACQKFGATDTELASLLSVSAWTIWRWKNLLPDFAKAIQDGWDLYDSGTIEVSLRQRAAGYSYDEVKIEEITVKVGQGQDAVSVPATKKTVTTKHVPPDFKSLSFWLCNRHPNRWKPATNRIEATGADGGPIKLITEGSGDGEKMDQREATNLYLAMVSNAN